MNLPQVQRCPGQFIRMQRKKAACQSFVGIGDSAIAAAGCGRGLSLLCRSGRRTVYISLYASVDIQHG